MAEGRKYDGGKLRYDLLPIRPLAEVVKVYTLGAKKYADRNWELGIEWSRVYGALQRHANAYWGGEVLDPELGTNHLASVIWCALALMEFEQTHAELDDRKKQEAAPEKALCVCTGFLRDPDCEVHEAVPLPMPTSSTLVSGTTRSACLKCGLWYNDRDGHVCFV